MKYFLITIVFLFAFSEGSAQRIVEDKVDPFDGTRTKQSSWVLMKRHPLGSPMLKFKIIDIDHSYYLCLKAYFHSVTSIDKGDKIVIKMGNGESIGLHNTDYDLASSVRSSGLWMTITFYPVDEDQLKEILEHNVSAIRVYTNNGYLNALEISKSKSLKFKKLIKLFI